MNGVSSSIGAGTPSLSRQQQRLWALSQHVEQPSFNTQIVYLIRGIGSGRVETALRELVERIDILRLHLSAHPTENWASPRLLSVDAALRRFTISEEGQERVKITLDCPSYVADANSAAPLATTLSHCLDNGEETETGAAFELVARWERDLAENEEAATIRAAWRERLEELKLAIAGFAAQPSSIFRPVALTQSIDRTELSDCLDRLNRYSGSNGSSEIAAMAAWAHVARRRLGIPNMPIGYLLSGRSEAALESVIGPMARMAPLRLGAGESQPFEQVLNDTDMGLFEAEAWQDSFAWQLARSDSSASQQMLFAPIAFARRKLPAPVDGHFGTIETLAAHSIEDRFVMRLNQSAAGLSLEYDAEQVTSGYAQRTLDGYIAFLQAAAEVSPSSHSIDCRRLPVCGDEENDLLAQLLTGTQAPPVCSVLAKFDAIVQSTPDRIAVLSPSSAHCTYAELDRRSRRLAAALQAAAAGPEDLIALMLSGAADRAAAQLAALRCGAPFVPMDPLHPPRRNAALIADLRPRVLLASTDIDPEVREACLACKTVILGPDSDRDRALRPVAVHPQSLAYVISTSGSTGRQKHVGVPHEALNAQINWFVERFGLGDGDRVLARTSATFDASLWELLAPLACGAAIVDPQAGHDHDVDVLSKTTQRSEVTRLQVVPSLVDPLLNVDPELVINLRTLFVGGEVLPGSLADRIAQSECEAVNLYGPAECCIQVTGGRLSVEQSEQEVCPVGRVLPGSGAGILDKNGGLSAFGAQGELAISGMCLARGYLGNPRMTAISFRPLPLSGTQGWRCFHTGDVGTQDDTGLLTVFGRNDDQLKIRGARVEPEEIASILRLHPMISDCAILSDLQSGKGKGLVAICATATGCNSLSDQQLVDLLLAHVPAYLVPRRFVLVSEMPRMSNGKTDRQRLQQLAGRREYEAPATPTERILAGIWQDLLGIQVVGRQDDFFMLGGHSVLILRLAARLRTTLGKEVPLDLVYRTGNLSELAAAIDTSVDSNTSGAGVYD